MALHHILTIALALLCAQALAKPPVVHDHLATDEEHFDAEGEHNPEYDHEAFAGAEASSFENLQPEDAKTKLR